MPHPRDHAFPGGFLFSQVANLSVPAAYQLIEVLGEWHYWADELAEHELHVEGNDFLIVHGLSLYLGESTDGLAKTLLRAFVQDVNKFHSELALVGGRYAVIVSVAGKTWIYQDPGGTRSVYYSTSVQIVASHATLLNEVSPHPADTVVPARPSRAWTRSPHRGILALVPNFRLNVENSRIERFFPVGPNRFATWSEEQKLTRIEELWARELAMMSDRKERILFSITGGGDSRVLASLARDYLDQYLAFTYTGKNDNAVWSESMALDEAITRQILEEVKLNHRFLRREDSVPVSVELKEILNRNSFQPHGRWLIPLYRGLAPEGDAIHMRGTLLEIGRAYWVEPGETDSFDELLVRATKYSGKSGEEYQDWLSHELEAAGYGTPFVSYDRRDLLYWEMRIGRWFAECLNETDAAFETFLPLNVREILDILLSFTLEERQEAHAYWQLVNRSYPVLNFFGRNDRRNLYEQVRDAKLSKRTELSTTLIESVEVTPDPVYSIKSYAGASREPQQVVNHTIRIPTKGFELGNYASWKIVQVEQYRNITFTMQNSYTNPRGLGVFHIEIRVDGQVVLWQDGAEWAFTSTVTLANLSPGALVEVCVVVDRTNKSNSWSRASRTAITDVSMTYGDQEGSLVVASSNPFAVTAVPKRWAPGLVDSYRKEES